MAEIPVEFDRSTQSIGALREAAYRIIRDASCQIDAVGDRYLCRLTPKQGRGATDGDGLREHFLDLVTDENLQGEGGRGDEWCSRRDPGAGLWRPRSPTGRRRAGVSQWRAFRRRRPLLRPRRRISSFCRFGSNGSGPTGFWSQISSATCCC